MNRHDLAEAVAAVAAVAALALAGEHAGTPAIVAAGIALPVLMFADAFRSPGR